MIRWLRNHLGRRGKALVWFAIIDYVYAYALVTVPLESSRVDVWFAGIMPLKFWATIWATVGTVCIINAFVRTDVYGFAGALGIKLLWGLVAAAGWAISDVPISSVAIWLGLARIVWIIAGWPEPEPIGEDTEL